LFVKGRVDGQPISKILNDGGATIHIMPYTVYRKLGKGDQDLTKTDMMLKDFEGNVSPVKGAICVELTIDSKTLPTPSLLSVEKVHITYFWGEIGFMPIATFLLQCINALFSG